MEGTGAVEKPRNAGPVAGWSWGLPHRACCCFVVGILVAGSKVPCLAALRSLFCCGDVLLHVVGAEVFLMELREPELQLRGTGVSGGPAQGMPQCCRAAWVSLKARELGSPSQDSQWC